MFNQQQQQFHQLMQLQHLLQQQQQHPAQHHPTPRSIPAPVQHQQPQQMLNIRGAAPARLINTHPMFQRALLMQHMQGNLRGLSMAAPTMSPFFTAAARQSILGTPPMGVTVKAPRVGFPGLPFQQPQRMYLKDHHRTYDRKKDGEQGVASHVKNEDEKQSEKGEIDLPPAASEADEESENLTECSVTDPSEPSAKRARSSEEGAGECHFRAGELLEDRERGGERSVESQPPEGISGGRALKVTIQQRSESRTISTTDLVPSHTDRECTGQTGPRFCCYICKSNFQSLQAFQSHLVTASHHQRFQAIQHLSNACLVTLMPTAKDPQSSTAGTDGKKQQQRWCNACQVHFSSDLITHLRTQEHKLAKRSLRPFCTVCSRHFKTPRKFVEHMKSPEHKQKSQELRMWEKESWSPEESEELITVDAVGCFEEEDEEDEDEGISGDEAVGNVQCPLTEREPMKEDTEEYNSEKAYGLDFMVPVTGYLCKLCHKFYSSDSASRLTHCKSLMHFQNVQRYSTTKNAMNAAEASTSCSPKPESLEGVEAGASIGSENTEWAEQMATIPDSLQAENGQGESDMANKEGVALVAEESGANKSVGGLQEPENIPAQGEKELINNEDSGAVAFQEEAAPFSSCHRLYQHKPR
ncbi:cip1-interacting zinc finger protein-like isoform X2 [Xenopus laevis]|uniref:Cip1-interacting zinc finger protein-like isoform X2 n=1 Tax=Xenopus laevis TaxID=8355 RepID=A0A8J1LHW0_XENLA|nr:cip1-interacting zinc finger protein-like isoform X2 [Xenopus laevis]